MALIEFMKLKLENLRLKKQILQQQSQLLQLDFDSLSRDEQKLLEEIGFEETKNVPDSIQS